MSHFTFLQRGECPICNGGAKGCRRSNTTDLLFCRDAEATPADYIYRGQDTWGFGLWQSANDAEAFNQQTRDEREQRRQEFLEAQNRRRQQQIAQQMPALQRDKWYHKLLERLTLTKTDKDKLLSRGFDARQIIDDGYRSVTAWQKVGKDISQNLPGVLGNGSLNVPDDAILCPIRNQHGLIVGCQLRLHEALDGRYRWLTSSTKKNPDGATPHIDGELPLGVFEPDEFKGDSVWLTEGTGFKPSLTRYKLGVPVVGAASGRFNASPGAAKGAAEYLCTKYQTKTLTFAVDAGDVVNKSGVPERWRQQFDFFQELGYECRVAWWGQITKDCRDIDELQTLDDIQYLNVEQFLTIAQQHGGLDVTVPKFPQTRLEQLIHKPEDVEFYTRRANQQDGQQEEFDEHVSRHVEQQRQERKITFLEAYPERVKRAQHEMRNLGTFNPLIQNTQFVELLVKDFLPRQEIPVVAINQDSVSYFGKAEDSLTNLPPAIYGLAAGMGSGKTTLGRRIVKEFTSGNLFSYRNSILVQASYHPDVKGRIHYLWDLEAKTEDPRENKQKWIAAKHGWMSGCVESIEKFVPKDTIILEEVEKIKDSILRGATCKRRRPAILREFERHLKAAKHVFCNDADVSASTLRWLERLSGKRVHVVKNVRQRFKWDCYFYTGAVQETREGEVRELHDNFTQFETDLLVAFLRGEPLLIATDSQRRGEIIERSLLQLLPEARGLRIDSHTKVSQGTKEAVQAFLENPDGWIQENQPLYIIYSPTCEASLDISIQDYFASVWGFFTHLNHLACLQMLGRLRTNAPRYIFCRKSVLTDDSGSRSPLPTEVAKHLFERNEATIREIVLSEFPEIKDDFQYLKRLTELVDFDSQEYKSPNVQALVEAIAMDNWSKLNLRQNLADELKIRGHNVIWGEMSAKQLSATSGIRKEIIEEQAGIIVNSEDISLLEAQEIMRSMSASLEQRYQATKTLLKERLPEFELTVRFVADCHLDDRQWINRQEMRYLLDNPETAQRFDRERWVYALKNDVVHWDVRSNSLAIRALQELGIPEIARAGEEWYMCSEVVERFKERALANRKLVKLALNITVNQDTDWCKVLNKCMRKAGYPTSGCQRRVGNERVRFYRVDPDVLAGDGIYYDVYEAIARRFAERLARLNASQVSQQSQVNITFQPICDTQDSLADEVSGIGESLDDILQLIENSTYTQEEVNRLAPLERERLEGNVELVSMCENWQMFVELFNVWSQEFRGWVVSLLGREEKERIRTWAMAA